MVVTLQPLAKLPQVAVAVAALVQLVLAALVAVATVHLLQARHQARLELLVRVLLAAAVKIAA
jgi:hypothetical protein